MHDEGSKHVSPFESSQKYTPIVKASRFSAEFECEDQNESQKLSQNYLDRYNELAYHESDESQEEEDELRSYHAEDKPEYPTVMKNKRSNEFISHSHK